MWKSENKETQRMKDCSQWMTMTKNREQTQMTLNGWRFEKIEKITAASDLLVKQEEEHRENERCFIHCIDLK